MSSNDPYWLDRKMEPGAVIMVRADGSIEDAPAVIYAPELTMGCLDDDAGSILTEHETAYIEAARAQGWEILAGWSGQYSYHGLCMHSSEFIGGNLAKHIQETPGLWAAITVDTESGAEPDSWALAYREATEYGEIPFAPREAYQLVHAAIADEARDGDTDAALAVLYGLVTGAAS